MPMKHKVLSYKRLDKTGRTVYAQSGYCGVIALAVALDVSFGKADALLKRIGARVSGKGGTQFAGLLDVLREYGTLEPIPAHNATNLHLLAKLSRDNNNRYIALTDRGGHVVCARAGVVEDYNGPKKRVFKDVPIYEFTPHHLAS